MCVFLAFFEIINDVASKSRLVCRPPTPSYPVLTCAIINAAKQRRYASIIKVVTRDDNALVLTQFEDDFQDGFPITLGKYVESKLHWLEASSIANDGDTPKVGLYNEIKQMATFAMLADEPWDKNVFKLVPNLKLFPGYPVSYVPSSKARFVLYTEVDVYTVSFSGWDYFAYQADTIWAKLQNRNRKSRLATNGGSGDDTELNLDMLDFAWVVKLIGSMYAQTGTEGSDVARKMEKNTAEQIECWPADERPLLTRICKLFCKLFEESAKSFHCEGAMALRQACVELFGVLAQYEPSLLLVQLQHIRGIAHRPAGEVIIAWLNDWPQGHDYSDPHSKAAVRLFSKLATQLMRKRAAVLLHFDCFSEEADVLDQAAVDEMDGSEATRKFEDAVAEFLTDPDERPSIDPDVEFPGLQYHARASDFDIIRVSPTNSAIAFGGGRKGAGAGVGADDDAMDGGQVLPQRSVSRYSLAVLVVLKPGIEGTAEKAEELEKACENEAQLGAEIPFYGRNGSARSFCLQPKQTSTTEVGWARLAAVKFKNRTSSSSGTIARKEKEMASVAESFVSTISNEMLRLAHLGLRIPTQKTNDGFELQVLDILMVCIDTHDLGTLQMATVSVLQHGASRIQEYEISPGKALLAQKWTELLIKAVDETMEATELSAMQRTRLVDELAHTQHGKSAIQGLVECLMLKGKQESFFADDDIVVDKLVNKAAKLLTKLAHFTKVCGTLKQLMVNETTGSAGSNLISKISICLNERQTEGVGTELRWQILLLISTLLQTDFSLGLKLGILPRDNQNAGNETGDALKEVKKVLSDDCECNLECFKVSPKKIYAALKVTLMLQENDAWRLVLKLLDPECWKVLCKPLFPAPFAIGEGFDFQAMDKDMLEQRWCDQVFVHSTVLMLLSNELLASAIGVDPDDADSYGRGSIGGGGADGGVGAATSEKLTLTIGYNGFAPTDTEDFKPNQKLKDLKDIMRKEGTRGAHGDSVVVNGLVLTDDDETIERICLRLRLWDPKLKKVTSEFHWVARKDFKVICDTILNAENAGAPAATAPTQPLALVAPGAVAAAPGGFGGAPAAPAATAPDVFSMESFVSIFGIDAKGDPVVRWTRASLNARQELISSWCSFIGLGTDPQIRRSCGFDQCNKTTLSWIYAVALALGKPAVGSGRVPNPSGPTLSLTIVRDDCPAPVQTGNPKLPAYRMKVRATLTDTVQQFCNAEITPLFNGTRAGENAGEYRLVFGGYPLDMTSTIDEIRQVGVRDGCELRWVPNGLCREIDLAMRHVPVGMCEEVDYGQDDEEDGVDSSNTVDLFARSAHATRVLSLSNLLLVLLSRVTETQRSHSTVSAQIASKKETLKALTQELAMPELDPSNEGDLKAQKAAAEESLTTLAGKLDSIDAIHDAADMVYCITTIFSCITGSIRTMLGQRDRNGDGVEINKVCQTLFQCTILLLKFAQHFKEQKLDVAAARVSGTPGSADSDESLLQTRFASLVQQECALMVPVLWNALDDTLRFHPDAEMEAAAASGSAKDSVDMTQKSILILLEFLMQRWFLKNGGEDDGAGSESYINPAVEHTLSRNGLVEIILSRLAACMAKKESLPFVRGTLHFFTSVMMKWFEPSVLDTPSDRLSSSTRHRATAVGLARAMLRSARGSNGVFSCLTEGTKRLYTNSSRGLFGAGSSWASGGDWAEAWRSSLDLAAAGLRALGHFGHIVDDSIQFFAVHCRRFVQLMEHLNPNPATSAANLADMPPIRPGSDFRSDLQELVSMLRFVAELSRFSAWPEQLPAIKSRTRGGGMADAAAYEGAGFVLRVARIFKWAADFMKTVDDAIEVETQRESNDRESRSTRTHLHQVQQAVQAAVACCLTILKNASMEKPLQSSLIVEDLTASMTLFQLEHKDAEKNFLREVESSRPSYATLKKVMEIAARDSHKHADADFPAAPTSLRVKKGEADFVLEHATMLMVSQARRVLRTWAEKIQFARNPVEKSAMEKDLEGYKKRLSDYLNVDIREVVARTLPMDQHRGSMGGRMSSMSGMSHLSRRTSSLSIFSSTSSRQGGGSADAYSYNSSHIPSPSTKFFEAVLTAFCEDMLSPTPVAVE